MNLTEKSNLLEPWNQFVLNGNHNALSKIYFHYYDQLFTYGLKHTSDKQIVEDSIQTLFLNFIRNRKGIGTVKNLSGYLMSAFRHQLFHNLSNQKKTILTGEIKEEKFVYFKNQEEEISDKEHLEEVHNAVKKSVDRLPSRQQEIIFLHFESGVPYEEIAKMLDITIDSCYKSVYRSVRTIREEVEKILGKGNNIILWFFSFFHGRKT